MMNTLLAMVSAACGIAAKVLWDAYVQKKKAIELGDTKGSKLHI